MKTFPKKNFLVLNFMSVSVYTECTHNEPSLHPISSIKKNCPRMSFWPSIFILKQKFNIDYLRNLMSVYLSYSPATSTPHRDKKSTRKIGRWQSICKKRRTDIRYPQKNFLFYNWIRVPSEKYKKPSSPWTRPRAMHNIIKSLIHLVKLFL